LEGELLFPVVPLKLGHITNGEPPSEIRGSSYVPVVTSGPARSLTSCRKLDDLKEETRRDPSIDFDFSINFFRNPGGLD
jgi:hypothetical protein